MLKWIFIVLISFPSFVFAQKTDAEIKIDIVKMINPERMIDEIRDFASPAFEGRELGTLGNTKATDWIKYKFIEHGLTPFPNFPNFEHAFEVKNYSLGSNNSIKVGELVIKPPYTSPAVWGSSTSIKSVIASKDEPYIGKIALVELDSTYQFNEKTFLRIYTLSKTIQAQGAIGIIFYWHTNYNDGVNIYRFEEFVELPLLAQKNIINTSKPYLYFEPLPLPILFVNNDIGKNLSEIAGLQVELSCDFKIDFTRKATNVLAYLPGKVDRLDKAIVLVAELDQEGVNSVNGTPYLGANSNGSGIVTLLEIVKAMTLMKEKPLYPVIFLAINGSKRMDSGLNSLFSNSDFTSQLASNTWIELQSTAYTYTEEDLSHVVINVFSKQNHLRKLPFSITRRPKIEADIDTTHVESPLHSSIKNHIFITSDVSPYTNRVVDAQNKMNYVTFYRIAEITADLVWRLANNND